jgi:hypothetical protein
VRKRQKEEEIKKGEKESKREGKRKKSRVNFHTGNKEGATHCRGRTRVKENA